MEENRYGLELKNNDPLIESERSGPCDVPLCDCFLI